MAKKYVLAQNCFPKGKLILIITIMLIHNMVE